MMISYYFLVIVGNSSLYTSSVYKIKPPRGFRGGCKFHYANTSHETPVAVFPNSSSPRRLAMLQRFRGIIINIIIVHT